MVRTLGKWKFFLGIFIGTIFVTLILNFVQKKPFTWHLVVFVSLFMIVMLSLGFLIDYFFGEQIRRNPRTFNIVFAVGYSLVFISAVVNLIENYIAGQEINWRHVFVGVAVFIIGIGWLRRVRLQKKR